MKNWKMFFIALCVCALNLSADSKIPMDYEQKTIGVIGGESWESTATYYKLINQTVRDKLGGLNSAKILLYSFNYDHILELEKQKNWNQVGVELARAAKILQDGGADFIILCSNTLHKVTPVIEKTIDIPFFHIADGAGKTLFKNQVQKVALLGTQFTMEDGFYASRLSEKFGITVIVPKEEQRKLLDGIINNELGQGKVLPGSKQAVRQIIQDLNDQGAEAILFSSTKLGMLISQRDIPIPLYFTALLHASEAASQSIKFKEEYIPLQTEHSNQSADSTDASSSIYSDSTDQAS